MEIGPEEAIRIAKAAVRTVIAEDESIKEELEELRIENHNQQHEIFKLHKDVDRLIDQKRKLHSKLIKKAIKNRRKHIIRQSTDNPPIHFDKRGWLRLMIAIHARSLSIYDVDNNDDEYDAIPVPEHIKHLIGHKTEYPYTEMMCYRYQYKKTFPQIAEIINIPGTRLTGAMQCVQDKLKTTHFKLSSSLYNKSLYAIQYSIIPYGYVQQWIARERGKHV